MEYGVTVYRHIPNHVSIGRIQDGRALAGGSIFLPQSMYIPSASSLLENSSTLLPSRPSPLQTATALTAHASAARGLVVIDADVADTDTLLAGLAPGIDVLRLDSNADGIAQVTQALSGRHDLTSLHFLTHGEAGDFGLGGTRVDRARLTTDGEEIQTWARAFTSDAAILLYGCNVAADGEGKALVGQLSALTGKEVEASTDLTGSSTLGGNWELEYKVGGDRDVPVAFNLAAREAYQQVLATFTVTSSANAGAGTLRDAIAAANSSPGADTIDFALPTTDPGYRAATPSTRAYWTIAPDFELPSFTGTVTVDATTQIGYSTTSPAGSNIGAPVIELNGKAGGAFSGGFFLNAGSSGSTIKGFAINEFFQSGIRIDLDSNNNTIQGNYIGTDITGTVARGNGISYSYLQASGVYVVSSSGNTIGGTGAGQGNLVSGNLTAGIVVFPGYTDPNARRTRPNDPLSYNTSGGNTETSSGNQIVNNFIGTDFTGTKALGNGRYGIFTEGNRTNIRGNLVSANSLQNLSNESLDGIFLEMRTSGSTVTQNKVGTDITGTQALGNARDGIGIDGNDHTITNNISAYNGSAGILLEFGDRVLFSQNSLFSNKLATIFFRTSGGAQPNHLQAAPVLNNVSSGGGNTIVSGSLTLINPVDATPDPAHPSRNYRIEFFRSSRYTRGELFNGVRLGDAQTYLGSTTVTIAKGATQQTADFSASFGGNTPGYYSAVAVDEGDGTATDLYRNDSSQVSDAIPLGSFISFFYTNPNPYQYAEGNRDQNIFIVRDGDTSGTATAYITFADGTAKKGVHYDYSAGTTVTFNPNESFKSFSIRLFDDGILAGDRTFTASLALNPTGPVTDSKVVTILEGDEVYGLKVNTPSVPEGNAGQKTPVSFTITRTGGIQVGSSIDFDLLGTAKPTIDYDTAQISGTGISLRGKTITFAAGATTATITFNVLGNNIYEPDKTVQIQLSNALAPGTATITPPPSGIITIVNDDPRPQITVSDISQTEGTSGITTFPFVVTLSGPTYETITLNYSTSDGTAIAGIDYNAISNGVLTFAPGETTKTVGVGVIGKAKYEPNKTFNLNLSLAKGDVTLTKAVGVGTVINPNPIPPQITINDIARNEGDSGISPFTFTVSLSKPVDSAFSVNYSTVNGTAIAGIDYNAIANGVLTFAPGETTKTIAIGVIGNTKYEPDKTFSVNISLATVIDLIVTRARGLGTILNDDPVPPQASIGDVSQREGDSGTSTFNFTVTLSGPAPQTITLNYSTANGTAIAGVDYNAVTNGVLTFSPGDTSKIIGVEVIGNTKFEPDKTFNLVISLASGDLIIAKAIGTGTILNDDVAPIPTPTPTPTPTPIPPSQAGTFFNWQNYLQFSVDKGQSLTKLLFNENYYLAQYSDVKAAVARGGFSSGFAHFLKYGQFESRDPSVYFSNSLYLSQNSDVAAAVAKRQIRSGFQHFVTFGFFEHRNLSFLLFDEGAYLAVNPDVKDAVSKGTFQTGYEHYLVFGQKEGRNPSQPFDEAYYLAQNPDVKGAVQAKTFSSGYDHFLQYGIYEGRDPSASFTNTQYLAANPDVSAAVQQGLFKSGFIHALRFGEYEGRALEPQVFDESYYLANNADVANAVRTGKFRSGFDQFVLYGQKEGRQPSTAYNEAYYLKNNTDVAAAVSAGIYQSGFEHFLLIGRSEGRLGIG